MFFNAQPGLGGLNLQTQAARFGAYATDRMLTEEGESYSSDEAYRRLGVGYDSRDYDSIMRLLKHHYPSGKIQMVMN